MAEKKKPELRFKGFRDDWEKCKLNEYLETSSEKNYENVFEKKDVLSVSGDYGIVNQIEFQGRSFAGTSVSNYGVVNTGDVVYTKSPLKTNPYGIIKTNIGKAGIVSTLYAIYHPKENADSKFIQCYFERNSRLNNYLHPLVNKGAKNDMKVTADNALLGTVIFPSSKKEQEKISKIFDKLDNLITLNQRKYEKLLKVKKAMLEKMFPKDSADAPEIRFKGFTDIWERCELGDICSIGDIDHKMPRSVIDGIPYVMTGNFVGINDLDFENSKLISTEDYEQLAKKIKPELGDILFARYASVGTVRYVETQMKFLVSYSCAILKHNDTTNGKYLFYYLQANEAKRQIELEINTGSQRNIGIDSLKKLIILLPQKNEQEEVSTFFCNLDNLITLHQSELEKLQSIKKALLDKMFV